VARDKTSPRRDVDALALEQVIKRGLRVLLDAAFRRLALTLAIPAV
jgi:hypothetical protein